jgi:hypothetical protein
MTSSAEEEALSSAFLAFIGECETTLTPGGFLRWIHEHRPDLLTHTSADLALAFAGRYFETPLRTRSEAPPLLPRPQERRTGSRRIKP